MLRREMKEQCILDKFEVLDMLSLVSLLSD